MNDDTNTTTTIDSQLSPILLGFARHGLTTLGGVLIAKGWLASSDMQMFIATLLVLGGTVWSVVRTLVVAEWHRVALLAAREDGKWKTADGKGVPAAPSPCRPPGGGAGVGPVATAVMLLGCLLMSGCAGFTGLGAGTTLFEDGKPVFASSGTHSGLVYHKTASETYLQDLTLSHDKATAAQWKGLNDNITALGDTATKVGAAMANVKTSMPSLPASLPTLPTVPAVPAAKASAKP